MIRRLLESITRRERILALAFLWAVLMLWMVLIMSSARNNLAELSNARTELATQKAVLSRSEQIKRRLNNAKAAIDPEKTLNAIRLSSTADSLAREAGLTADIGSAQHKKSGIFNTNSVRLGIRAVELEQLINFTQSVQKMAPYLTLSRFKMNADNRDPNKINAEIEIESFELNTTLSR